jgi:hypothetical protein
VLAAEAMRRDGWWWNGPQLTNKAIKRRVFKEMLQARWASGSTGQPAASPIGSINSPRSR